MTEKEYLTVQSALALVLESVDPLPALPVALTAAVGSVLAVDVNAADSLPPFANSAMDGYAVRAADLAEVSAERPARLRVVGEIAAGSAPTGAVSPGGAMRIMTGAPMPPGADAVVPVEDTSEPWRDEERPLPEAIWVRRALSPGDYVRHAGEDIVAGERVLSAGVVLRPQEIGVLASLGVDPVTIVRRPRVGILATGDELVPVSAPLTPGKIRNSNSLALTAQVRLLGAEPVNLGVARDTEEDVRARLQAGVDAGVDLFVSSAGVSVGAYDVVKAVLEQGGDVAFWRVRMRPGKPLAHGRYAGIPYLGLPGNPVSALVSFERFARPAILKLAGHTRLARPQVEVVLDEAIHSDGRESYVRAVVRREPTGYRVRTTGSQGSHIMTSLLQANALLIVPEGVTYVEEGETLTALMIDWPESVF